MSNPSSAGERSPSPSFPIFELPRELIGRPYSIDTFPRLFHIILAELEARGIRKDDLVLCGFTGSEVRISGSFGSRSRTWGMTDEFCRREIEQGAAGFDPATYLTEFDPAIAVFDRRRLIGGVFYDTGDDGQVTEETMFVPTESLPFALDPAETTAWQTEDDTPLDSATLAVFFL